MPLVMVIIMISNRLTNTRKNISQKSLILHAIFQSQVLICLTFKVIEELDSAI